MNSHKKILLIEDSPGDASLIEEFLSSTSDNRFMLTWINTLSEAKDVLKNTHFDAALLDINLSDSQGKDTIDAMTLDMSCVPVIVLSGNMDEQLAIHAVKVGAQDYLMKNSITPFSLKRAILFAIERKNIQRINERHFEAAAEPKTDHDKFLSIVAHDLRSPLHSLMGLTELLASDFDSFTADEVKKYCRDLYLVTKNQFVLLENLLGWSTVQTGKIEFTPVELNIHKKVNEAIGALRFNAKEKNIDAVNNTDQNLTLFADAKMLFSVFQNLISNAIKFTGRGGRIEISSFRQNGSVEIAVNDTGVGMTQFHAKNIFRTTNPRSLNGTENEKGTGLGLMLCKEFIQMHGGTIRAESRVGGGTSFFIRLPIEKKEAVKETIIKETLDDDEYIFG